MRRRGGGIRFLEQAGGVERVGIAMVAVVGGILLLFVLAAARRARRDLLDEERDRLDD